jgi:hypothetical protein
LKAKGDEKAATIDDVFELLKSAAKKLALMVPIPCSRHKQPCQRNQLETALCRVTVPSFIEYEGLE